MPRSAMIIAAFVGCLTIGISAAQPAGLWLDVPFVRQDKDGCGAASLAMVMQYWLKQQGRALDQSADAIQIQRALYSPQARGIYASDLEHYLQQHGFRTFAFRGEWKDLKQHLEKGRPLIVALKPGASMPLHYLVVVGLEPEVVLVNDPAQKKLLKQERGHFEQQWTAAGNWTLLAVPQADDH
jgi:predicted double-glycine peptidase